MTQELVKVCHLGLCYGRLWAIRDISFEIYSGEIFAVIGPNGSGKTSTMECLEGLRIPTEGTVEIFGMNPRGNREAIYNKLGIQLQDTDYPSKIKVKELCSLFASFYDKPADWKQLLKQLGLDNKAGRAVAKLSGGEKQRLSILLALLPRPKLLIFDELTTGLDPEIRHSIWESLKLIRDNGTSIILVSHYLDEVEILADRLMFLSDGKIQFSGTQDDFRKYAKEKSGLKNIESLSLEQVYLLLTPQKDVLTMEGLL